MRIIYFKNNVCCLYIHKFKKRTSFYIFQPEPLNVKNIKKLYILNLRDYFQNIFLRYFQEYLILNPI